MMAKISVVYCTGSGYKHEEWNVVKDNFELCGPDGKSRLIRDLIDLDFRTADVREPLLCDLGAVVREKAISAYAQLQVPCIVEHAGLIFEELEAHSYPGGLTQPMWDALEATRFVQMKGVAGSGVIAEAIVGYCDGMAVHLFTGQTHGVIADCPRGKRSFYWDNVFCPDGGDGLTYAEIADSDGGLLKKMTLSQPQKAMLEFFKYRISNDPRLFC
jgi:inosine/xanthosine triphosphate pyrophosphatase family protein